MKVFKWSRDGGPSLFFNSAHWALQESYSTDCIKNLVSKYYHKEQRKNIIVALYNLSGHQKWDRGFIPKKDI